MRNNLDDILQDAIDKGLIYYSNTWIEKAVQLKSRNLTIEMATSKMYVYVADRRNKEMRN